MSKCKECGSELAEGAKFCGECGAKVPAPVKAAGLKCPECGAELADGVKFCGECGCKMQKQGAKKSTGESGEINWDSPFTMADGMLPLTDEQVESVAFSLNRLTLSADPNRVVMPDSGAFKEKIREFKKVYSHRLGDIESKEAVIGLMDEPIGFIDFGDNGLGKRGTLFARRGIFYITKEQPKVVDGEPVGGFVPWKLFYKFGKPRNEKCYCLVEWKDVLASSDVDEDVKENFGNGDEGLISRFFFINTGLSQEDVKEFMDEVKSGLVGDEAEPAGEVPDEEPEFEEEEE